MMETEAGERERDATALALKMDQETIIHRMQTAFQDRKGDGFSPRVPRRNGILLIPRFYP